MKSIRILLMIEDAAARERFRTLLGESLVAQQEGIQIVAEPATVEAGLRQVEQLQPDLILLDEALVKASAASDIDLVRQFVKIPGPAKVLVLCAQWKPMFLHNIRLSGASWIIQKEATFEEILDIIRQTITPDRETREFFKRMNSRSWLGAFDPEADLSKLTRLEREVFKLAEEGKSPQQIATALRISAAAVENCRRMIFLKLMPENRLERKLCPN